MNTPEPQLLGAINQIAENLSSSERSRIFYLCERTDDDNSTARVKEMLRCRAGEVGHLLLMALMLQLRRFDILKKVCNSTKAEVESAVRSRPVLSRFRVLIDNISDDMASEDLDNMKFLLSKTLSREQMEKSKSFLDVIVELEKLDVVSPERVDMLEKYLDNISRVDLAKKVREYKRPAGTSQQCTAQQQRLIAAHQISSPTRSQSPQQMRGGQPCQNGTGNVQQMYVRREPSSQSQQELYKFNTNPRGVCLIIDCVGKDGDMLQETFKALHFKVVLHKWLSVDDLQLHLRAVLTMRETFESDCFVCCIISRGATDNLWGTDQYSIGLQLDTVRQLFTPDKCPALIGKPKLFFIQRYNIPVLQPMHHQAEDWETDGGIRRGQPVVRGQRPRCDSIPNDADVFWSHCWTDDRQLERGDHGSVYLRALVEALHKGQRRKMNVHEIHTEVNAAVFDHNRRNPEAKYQIILKHTLLKDLYLQ